MGKIYSIVKIVGLSYALFGGTLTTFGIGVPLYFVGDKKINEASSYYERSDEYKKIRAAEDEKLNAYRIDYENAEKQFENGKISSFDFYATKDTYERELRYSEEELFKDSFEETQNEQVKAMLKSGNNYKEASFTVMIVAFLYMAGKHCFTCLNKSSKGAEKRAVSRIIIDGIKDSIEELKE